MRDIAIFSTIGLWVVVLLVFSVVTVRYRITARHLVISWVGLPVRWVRLKNIKQITVQRIFWTERWFNSLRPANRYLLIEKKVGLIFRHLSITPKNHMVFKADLERARAQVLGEQPPTSFLAANQEALTEAASSSPSSR